MPLLFRLLLVLLLGCALTLARADESVPVPSPFEAALPLLLDSKFPVKEQAIEQLARTEDPRLEELFTALLAGDLYQIKSNASLVMATGQEADLRVKAIPGGEPIAGVSAADLKKITLNNRMRGQLKAALARLDLSHADPGRRLAAVTSLLNDPGGASREVLTERLSQETDAEVRETTALVLALLDLRSPDPARAWPPCPPYGTRSIPRYAPP